jgi:hypothetical protein
MSSSLTVVEMVTSTRWCDQERQEGERARESVRARKRGRGRERKRKRNTDPLTQREEEG